jgi:NAD(P)H-dependent FMN reductase
LPLRLAVIVASTRPVRVGHAVGRWFETLAAKDDRFEIDFVDLRELALPMMDEPKHPRLREYTHEHTKNWSRIVDAADAFVIVTPEYNYAPPASIKNALDYLLHEWGGKPAGIVSYGGASGGLRSAEKLKGLLVPLDIMPVSTGVPIFSVAEHRDEAGVFHGKEVHERSAHTLLNALHRWGTALKRMREGG